MSETQQRPVDGGGRSGGRGNRRKGGGGKGRGGGRGRNNKEKEGGKSDEKTGGNNNTTNTNNNNSSSSSSNNNNKSRKNNNRRRRGGKEKAAAAAPLSEEEKLKLEEEKKAREAEIAAEAERRRVEEEKRAAEEARAKREKEHQDLQRRIEEACQSLTDTVETVRQRKTNRSMFAAESLANHRKGFEASKKKLKSDLKKCTAFVKKIKSGGAWSMKPADISKDVSGLNLSRYVEEVVAAFLETKLKLADVPVVVALCSAMHLRYDDFLRTILPKMWAVVHAKATEETAKLRRIYVRLITEFLLNGLVTEPKQLIKLISEVTGGTSGNYAVTDASLVVAFVKAAGFEVLGTKPKSITETLLLLRSEAEKSKEFHANESSPSKENVPADNVEVPLTLSPKLADKAVAIADSVEEVLVERAVRPAISEVFLAHCSGAYQTLATSLVDNHSKLQKLEKRCEQDRLLAGSLSEAREKGLNDARRLLESLQKSVETLSDVLNLTKPELEEEQEEALGEGSGVGVELWTKEGDDSEGNDFGPFDDEETRSFYCDIPDLLTTIPPALLGMSEEQIGRLQAANRQKYGADVEVIQDIGEGEGETSTDLESTESLNDQDDEASGTGEGEVGEENKDTPHYRLMTLLEQELPECNRRELVDELAEKFCVNHGSSKHSRKRLAKALFLVPLSRLDLLPYFSRLAAIMDRIFPDIPSPLTIELEQQFHGQAKFKKNQSLDARLKTARYLGELTKFRVAPPIISLRCIRKCLDDFTGFNIDVACCLLESCGRYLYKTKHTVGKLTSLMDTMMRISKAKNLDERAQSLINSAFFMVKPPPAAPRKQAKVYPPLEAYLRHLMLVRLVPEDASISFVTKQLLKFPWNDPAAQCGALVCKYMLKACRKGRYKAIAAVAAVAANIRRNKPEVAARVVDACLEEIQWALEHPSFRDQQRTVTYARLLGELHSVSLVTGQIILQQLFMFINFGHDISEALRDASEKHTEEEKQSTEDQNIPVFNSAGGTTQTIHEDEEIDDGNLETKEEEVAPKAVAVSRHSRFDPRVPSPLDQPNSVFRIKLVCTLLEASVKNLVTRNSLSSLDKFMAAFQRYLFTKSLLPAEVEFSLLDTFDALDSQWRRVQSKDKKRSEGDDEKTGFQRFGTWIDAHNATVSNEEADAKAENVARARLEAVAGLSQLPIEGGELLTEEDLALINEQDEDFDAASQSDDESETSDVDFVEEEEMAGADVSVQDDVDDDDDMSMDDESDDDSHDEMEDDDEFSDEEVDSEAHMRQLEAEAFERELRRLTMDALERGKSAARASTGGKVADYMPSGSQFIRKKGADPSKSGVGMDGQSLALGGKEGVSFQLLKKGNKGRVEAKELIVPSDTNLAKRATKHDDEAAREHDILKARVLQYEAESAENEMTGGNVYLEQTKLQVIRNRPLSMEDIDRNFGSTNGDTVVRRTAGESRARNPGRGGRGGRGGGRGRGGRTLKNY